MKTIKQEEKEIFFTDMFVLGFDKKEALIELGILKECETEADYIKASRIGRTVSVTRKQRKEIFSSYATWAA